MPGRKTAPTVMLRPPRSGAGSLRMEIMLRLTTRAEPPL